MRNKTILLVEDNPDDEALTLRALEKNKIGENVIVARDGAAALDFLFCRNAYADRDPNDLPQLVLLDLTMEDMDGIQVLRKLRELDAAARVIVVSADVQTTTELMVKEAGGVAFLGKPVAADVLLRTIDSVMQGAA